MAEATKDLPDPLEGSSPPAPASPDDLLAQMADEAIDKLIADADRGITSDAPAAVSEPASESNQPAQQNGMQAELDTLFGKIDSDGAPARAQPVSAGNSLPMPPPVDVPQEIANADFADAPAAEISDPDVEQAMRTDVKALLDDAVHQSRPRAAPAFIVVPLRLMNAPFAGLSDPARDIVGQIAILTLINALAVIVYVILFR